MPKPSKVGKPIHVVWEDAWAESGYWTTSEISSQSGLLVNSYGMCIRDDKDAVTVAAQDFHPQQAKYRGVLSIPRGMVRSVKVLR